MIAGSKADSEETRAALSLLWPRSVQFALLLLVGSALAIVVGQTALWGARPETDGQEAAVQRIDLNQACRAELQLLPGVGEGLAQRIEHGRPYRTIEDLRRVPGIGPKTFERLRLRVAVGSPARIQNEAFDAYLVQPTRRPNQAEPLTEAIAVNTAVSERLQQLPGIGPVLAERIVAERNRRPFASIQDLRRVKGIGPKTLAKLKPWVIF